MWHSLIFPLLFITKLVRSDDSQSKKLLDYMRVKASSGYPFVSYSSSKNKPKSRSIILTMNYPKVLNLDEKEQSFTALFELRLEWIEENLRWNASSFMGIDQILFPKNLLWFPDISVANGKNVVESKSMVNSYVKIHSYGKVLYTSTWVVSTICDMDLVDFPFDNQTCTISFTMFSMNKRESTLVPQIVTDYNYNMGNSVWHVDNLFSYVQLYDQAGEEFEMVSLGVAIFVAYVIFGSILTEKVNFANGQPIIVAYLIIQLFLCLFSIILSVLAPFLYWKLKKHEEGHPDPLDVPSPRDEFSLESERKSYEDHLERIKKRMSAAVDSCVIELRMTLNNINEIVRYRTESKWRRRVWQASYARIELGIFVALQLLNFAIFMTIMYHWK